MRGCVVAALLALSLVGLGAPARAAGPPEEVVKAREAYERGARASKSGDYARAATEFARADELAPSPTALEAALDAAVQADDPALGHELLERSERGPVSGSLAQSVSAARAKFAGRGGLIRVPCPNPPCKVAVDGREVDPQKPIWAANGAHGIVREDAAGTKTTMLADVKPDSVVEAAPPPPPAPSQEPPPRTRLPPFVFFAAAGLTVVAGVATIAFGLDANGTHDDFEKAGCRRGLALASGCATLRDDGESAETRTNIALVSTLVLGAATALVGLYFTDWRGGNSSDHVGNRGRRAPRVSFPTISF